MILRVFRKKFQFGNKNIYTLFIKALKLNWILIAVLNTQTFSVNIDYRQITEFFGIMQFQTTAFGVCLCMILGNIECFAMEYFCVESELLRMCDFDWLLFSWLAEMQFHREYGRFSPKKK